MRFIGNKELIVPEIKKLLDQQGLLSKGLTFFDAFCGSGAVADSLKDSFDIVINDLLKWCVVYSRGRLVSNSCRFEALKFDPFEFFKSNTDTIPGFFYRNYSPGGSQRMYFTPENAGRIDYIRSTIEDWQNQSLINADEHAFLLASLIESISLVSNTAGVYGAFLKHWDVRATKPIIFNPVVAKPCGHGKLEYRNERIEEIIESVDCDVLYLDPPYTQNQYGTQYHILETLTLNDEPTISPITGSRPTGPMRSDWSKDVKKHILFDRLIARTNAKYIIFSYSPDGFMSKSFIEATLKRYGEAETYVCKPLSYRKYTNFKSRRSDNHSEYLFFVKTKPKERVYYASPLNYIGSKTRMIPFLKEHFPETTETFVDAFGGGFNVGINSTAKRVIYNDYNYLVKNLIESFHANETSLYVAYVRRQIKKYDLQKEHSENYLIARNHYNSLPAEKRDPKFLFTLIMYGFNQQIRFNGDHQFNNPIGQRWFNDKVLEKVISFSRAINEKNVIFKNVDYYELLDDVGPGSFVYMDPPYRLTTGAYNDGKRGFEGWDVAAEKRMFEFAEKLNSRGVNFMLSYVEGHRGKVNGELKKWLSANDFRLIECEQIQGVGRKEVVIVNYG
jgi:adenine-specific DNA-methyltransferase